MTRAGLGWAGISPSIPCPSYLSKRTGVLPASHNFGRLCDDKAGYTHGPVDTLVSGAFSRRDAAVQEDRIPDIVEVQHLA